MRITRLITLCQFQSTLPVRGGTDWQDMTPHEFIISIHPPRAGRDIVVHRQLLEERRISIHPPRAGRDAEDAKTTAVEAAISIHPPRAGRDSHFFTLLL